MLAELSTNEVKALALVMDGLRRGNRYWRAGVFITLTPYYKGDGQGLRGDEQQILESTLMRLGICGRPPVTIIGASLEAAIQHVIEGQTLSDSILQYDFGRDGTLFLTALGAAFVEACQGPVRHSDK